MTDNTPSTPDPLFRGRLGWNSIAAAVTAVTAAAMTVLHLVQVQFLALPAGLFKTAHLVMGTLVVCFAVLEGRSHPIFKFLAMIAAAMTIVGAGYIFVEYENLVTNRAIFGNAADAAISIVLLLAALYAAWRAWGWGIPLLALLALLYGYFGYVLPGDLLFHGGISVGRLMSYTAIPFFQGLLGGLTELSASTIFIFLFFGAVLSSTGGVDFILEVARRLGGRTRAGPAQVAVIGSSLMGMISGSTVANIASTGSMTIPMMKRFGFRSEFAGAVEAAASMGGQLTPPVMGLAAFLIVGLTGAPYTEVMVAALIPALIYYAYLIAAVHIRAVKEQIVVGELNNVSSADHLQALGWLALILRHIHIIAGIGLLIALLMKQLPAGLAALHGSVFMLVLNACRILLFSGKSSQHRASELFRSIYGALTAGGRTGAQVAVILAIIGILVEILTVTGFAQKLSGSMLDIADGRPWLLSLIVAIACMVFGLGLPTPAAYLIVALLGAPALVETGVPLLAAHLFVFYFANVSALTPPIAIAALVAANIAKGKFLPTALAAIRLSLPAFLLPFLFLAHPEILGLAGGPKEWIFYGLSAFAGVTAINVAIEGHALGRLNAVGRALMALGGGSMLVPGGGSTLVGLVLILAVLATQGLLLRRDLRGVSDISDQHDKESRR